MKYITLSTLVLLVSASAFKTSSQGIIIKGQFMGTSQTGEKIYLTLNLDGYGKKRKYLDSVSVENQRFEFDLADLKPGQYEILNSQKQIFPLYLEEGVTYVDIAPIFMSSKVRNNETDSIIRNFNELYQSPNRLELAHSLKVLQMKKDGAAVTEAMEKVYVSDYEQAVSKIDPAFETLVRRNDLTSAWVLLKSGLKKYDLKTLEKKYAGFPASVKESRYGELLNAQINKMRSLNVGSVAPDFIQNDINGKPIQLSSFIKGKKIVLIDFWASWCGPCRAENPNVVRIYNKYKDKGFDILGVSLDNNKESWIKAIKADGLGWSHVSDLAFWRNEVAVQYDIKSVPQTFLLDENGVIIAHNLHGEDLEKVIMTYTKK